ncbi:MAG TPA: ABC transporter permease [Candidatus Acidoferrum sp.]|nr:ABC transporter permease [Candidatus Acidoferrum sp.]
MVRVWLRSWWRSPLLTAQFSLTIAIGMGAAAALLSLMLALGYQPLTYRDSGQLVAVWERAESGAQVMAISGPDLTDFADATHDIFASLGAFTFPRPWLLDRKGATEIHTFDIQAGAFSDLGIRPVLGREVQPDDEPLSSSVTAPVWISYRFWQTRYGGSPSVIGMTVGLASDATGAYETRMRIVGVLPLRVDIPLPFLENAADVWYLAPHGIAARSRQSTVFFGLGRLRPGVSVAQAQAALTVVAERLGQRYSFDRRRLPVVQSLEAIAQGPARQTTGLLALGVGFVFLVGCVNLAIVMGVEGRRRRREIAIRAVLGAGRRRLWREVAAEKCLLTLLSLGLGVAFASALLRVLAQLVPAAGLGPPLLHPPPLNLAVLLGFAAFAFAAALVWSVLLVAAADGPRTSRALAAAGGGLGYTGLSDSGPGAGRWRLILLAAQAGIGICLLAAAALTARTYAAVSSANLGPAPSHTVVLSVSPRDNFVPTDAQVADFNQQVLSRLERLPDTQAIALADLFPPPGSPISFEKQGDAAGTEREATSPSSVSPGYFRTLGIPILFGRGFDDTDNTGGDPVAIVNLDMAQANWTSPAQAVGSQIAFGPKFDSRYKIVGVAANFIGYWSQQPVPTVYLPQAQSAYFCGGEVILRTAAPARTVVALAPQALAGMAIPATISGVSTLQARWQATLTRPLARMAGMLLLALLGLGLSVQGVYAVTAGTVAARGHELAVRSALGALPGRLAWSVTRELVLAVIVGAGFGAAAAVELRPLLQRWLGPAAVWEAEPIAVAVLLLALAAAAGCYVPARAATRANPVDMLRQG